MTAAIQLGGVIRWNTTYADLTEVDRRSDL